MSLADLTGHLEDLASSQSGLRRSRAMAQLWSEIRSSDVEERRAFALALADRFAPSLAVKFQEASGLDGPEFIRLVRSLIEMDGDDIHEVVADLERLVDHRELAADEIKVAELIDTAEQLTDESGRDDLMGAVFERLVAAVDATDDPGEAPVELSIQPVPIAIVNEPVPDLAVMPDVDVTEPDVLDPVTPYDLAIERMDDIDDERLELPQGRPQAAARERVSFAETPRRSDPESQTASEQPLNRVAASGNRALVDGVPDGWRRRRVISSLIRDDRISVGEALALSDRLTRSSDVRWIIGDLIQRGLTLSDRALLASRALPTNLRRRLEASS